MLRVKDWDKYYEDPRSRTYVHCQYARVPNKQDGLGLTTILAEPDGATIYGIWCLLLGALSRQRPPRNGCLSDDGTLAGKQWTTAGMALRWRRTAPEIERAIAVLLAVEWLEDVQSDNSCQIPTESDKIRQVPPKNDVDRTEQTEQTEQNRTDLNRAEQTEAAFLLLQTKAKKPMTERDARQLLAQYPTTPITIQRIAAYAATQKIGNAGGWWRKALKDPVLYGPDPVREVVAQHQADAKQRAIPPPEHQDGIKRMREAFERARAEKCHAIADASTSDPPLTPNAPQNDRKATCRAE